VIELMASGEQELKIVDLLICLSVYGM